MVLALAHLILFVDGGCTRQDTADGAARTTVGSVATNSASGFAQNLRLMEQQNAAGLILETTDWTTLKIKKFTSREHSELPFLISDLKLHLNPFPSSKSVEAVVIVPSVYFYSKNQLSDDEVVISISEQLTSMGIKRVHFHALVHGLWTEPWRDGIPTKDQAMRRKAALAGSRFPWLEHVFHHP